MKKYFNEEIINLVNIINKHSRVSKKYDLIYLFASPITTEENLEAKAPISYIEEIKIIFNIMKKTGYKFNCLFECAGHNVLRDIIIKNKTKILHISSHGAYNGNNYFLCLENLEQNGQRQKIIDNSLDHFLNLNQNNIKKLDLVFLSTCYSGHLAKLFIKYGAKNVIYVDSYTEVKDQVSVVFTDYFYQELISGNSIKKSFDNAIELMKKNKEVINLNNNSCCCNHFHFESCIFHNTIDLMKSKEHNKYHEYECLCNYEQKNYHTKECFEQLKIKFKAKGIDLENEKNLKIKKGDIIKICCCDKFEEGKEFVHNEILKIKQKSKDDSDYYSSIKPYQFNGKGKININSNLSLYFNESKFSSILGRKALMGQIFKNISKNEKYTVLYGEKGLEKVNFAESLCVYLAERYIINDYEIRKIK